MSENENLQELRELRAELASIRRSQAMVEFSLHGTIMNANDNFLRAMGYTLDEVVGRQHSIFIPASERQKPGYDAFWAGLRRGIFRAAVLKRVGKNGREIWWQATYNPVLDETGNPFKIVKYATDVTQEHLKSAEKSSEAQAIRRSQGIIEFSMDGTILTANEHYLRAMGYTLPEIIGQHHSMFIARTERDSATYTEFWDHLRQGRYHSSAFKRVAKGGREVWLQATYNPIIDVSGIPFKVVKVALDVTRDHVESADNAGQIQAIRRSQGVVEFSLDGKILTANDTFLRLMGYTLDEVAGKPYSMFLSPAERTSASDDKFWADLRRGGHRVAMFKHVSKSGEEIWWQATYNPILDKMGKPLKVVQFATNVTAQIVGSLSSTVP